MSDPALNQPTLRKWMPICQAVGEFQNGDMEGDLSRGYLASLVANLKKYPRQIPVYLSTGAPNPDHPQDLDERFADGWVEGLEMRGDWLYGDVKTHGQAAVAIANDMVRGASIGTVQGKKYDGAAVGPVLEHLVITNQPFVKGMNIAASRSKGGEPVAYHFTALKEAAMAEDKNDAGASGKDGGDEINLTEQLEAKDALLVERDQRIQELEAANANLLDEVKAFKEAPDLLLAQKRIKQLERITLADKIRRVVGSMVRDGQINTAIARGWYDNDSNETVIAGFKSSQMFKGDEKLMDGLRGALPKQPRRAFISGSDEAPDGELNAQEREAAIKAGKDPEVLAKTRGASNLTEWKERRKAAGKE